MNNRISLSHYVIAGLIVAMMLGKAYYEKKITTLTGAHQTALNSIAFQAKKQSDALLEKMKIAQQQAEQLDQRYTKELLNAESENQQLRDALLTGHKRLQLANTNLASCVSNHGDTSASRVGNAAKIRFSSEAGQLFSDIRAGIIQDQAKLDYLQNYIRQMHKQCRSLN